jgi:ADP-ribose pyrophosphatase YjhB (NUDIX family)
MNESEFLASYNSKDFDSPLLTVDSVLFTIHEDALKVLLVKRSNHPCLGFWGLPGGFVDMEKDQSLEDTVIRKLVEKTAIAPPYIEPLICAGGAHRDKRGWSVTACYTALISYQACHTQIDSVSDAKWFNVKSLDTLSLAFDHETLIEQAHERLRQKALYSIVPAYALPEKFTLPELQRVHELILDREIQKKSFRRRIEQAELLLDTGEKQASGKRQAVLYRMQESAGGYRFVRNLEQ